MAIAPAAVRNFGEKIIQFYRLGDNSTIEARVYTLDRRGGYAKCIAIILGRDIHVNGGVPCNSQEILHSEGPPLSDLSINRQNKVLRTLENRLISIWTNFDSGAITNLLIGSTH